MTVFLGLDYGKKRIGIAVGDDDRFLAFAVGAHVEGRDGSVFDFLGKIVAERDIHVVVLGLPLTADGKEGEMTAAVRDFADRLKARLDLPVVFWDERFSSAEADRWLGPGRKRAKEDRDALAAEIILQSYLDHLRASAAGLNGEDQGSDES